MNNRSRRGVIMLAVAALYAALYLAGKMALSALPNIEIISVLIASCAYAWGIGVALFSVNAFIIADTAIWGVNVWLISSVIYWNLFAALFWALSRARLKRVWATVLCATLLAVTCTALYGALTTATQTLVGYGNGFYWTGTDFAARFVATYVSGIPFYVAHVACNAVMFAAAFYPLQAVAAKAKLRFAGQ